MARNMHAAVGTRTAHERVGGNGELPEEVQRPWSFIETVNCQ
jgi:hypothetical protein